ncbi:hypothetical protein pipiens_010652 [Culex pipiens pipiens]|uniref:Endonuclease/exonuclease/phosphatase domain-containing protein n=1 Tax=Culex pipiens pipiens TaxID=38569 RepID=A0ABD1D9E1_CULPP
MDVDEDSGQATDVAKLSEAVDKLSGIVTELSGQLKEKKVEQSYANVVYPGSKREREDDEEKEPPAKVKPVCGTRTIQHQIKTVQSKGTLSFITVYYQNAGGMRTKTKQFFLALASSDYDVIALSETWLQDDIVDAELSSNYNLFRQDRNELTSDRSRGGGVLIAVKKAHDFTCTRVLSAGYEHLEQVAVRIKARNHTVYVCCIYIRPNSPPDVYTSHGTAVQELVDLSSNDDSIIVTGDYNLPHLAWTFDVDVNGFIPLNASTEQELALTENVVATGLLQICSLANVNGRILDLAFVNDTLSVELIEPPKPILRTDRHHKPFILRVDFPDIPGVATRIEDAEPDFSRCDFDRVTESLSSIDWDDILQDQDSNTSTTIFYDVLYEIVRQFVPSKRVSRNRTEKLPWWNADLRNRRNILRKARKRLFKAGTPENQTAVDRLEIDGPERQPIVILEIREEQETYQCPSNKDFAQRFHR